MDSYEKYYKFNEYIKSLKLEKADRDWYEGRVNRLKEYQEKENVGTLDEKELGGKKQLFDSLDSWIKEKIEDKRLEIEEKIEKFRISVSRFNERMNDALSALTIETDIVENINVMIKEMHEELQVIVSETSALMAEIDEFKQFVTELGYDEIKFTMNYKEINVKLKSLKDKFVEIKRRQVILYNARVEYINKMIIQFKGMSREGLSPEIIAIIDSLVLMETCKYVRSWTEINYITNLNYKLLIQMQTSIIQISDGLTPLFVDLDSEIEWIEKRLEEIEKGVADAKTPQELKEWSIQLSIVCSKISEFDIKLNNSKSLIDEERFKKYEDRINDAQAYAAEINENIKAKMLIPDVKVSDYEELKIRLDLFQKEVVHFDGLTEALFGKIRTSAVAVFEQELATYEGRLEEFEKEIEDKFKEGKLDENQYAELMKKVAEIRETLENIKPRLMDPEIAKDVDVFAFLNGEIDGLETAVDIMIRYVESLEKPIKDKNVRKKIDKELERLEKEYKTISDMLEKHKEDDPEKYEAARARLDAINEKMEKLGKDYRKKCPFLIRTVKSAKAFYKKHPKTTLVIAGLAAIALIHATVGPVLIPAIMHGNLMLSGVPGLGGFTSFVNGILGPMVGATRVQGFWYLANGARLASSASGVTALLKGLAVVGMGTAGVATVAVKGVSAVVGMIKELAGKMKKHELKEQLTDDEDKKADKDSRKTGKKKTKQADKMSVDELAKMFREFRKSGKTLDEFCLEHELTDEEKLVIQYLDARSKENEETLGNTGRRGR